MASVYSFRGLVGLAILALLCGGASQANGDTILSFAAARGIRLIPSEGGPLLLDSDPFPFLSIMVESGPRGLDDRTVLEFNLSGLSGPVTRATLDLDLADEGPFGPEAPLPPGGIIDVYSFFGNGVITVDDFFAGTFLTNFTGESALKHLDVTNAVQAAIDAKELFIGFRLSTVTGDRFGMGPAFGVNYPTLTIVPASSVPEPSSVFTLGIGLAAVIIARRVFPMRMHVVAFTSKRERL